MTISSLNPSLMLNVIMKKPQSEWTPEEINVVATYQNEIQEIQSSINNKRLAKAMTELQNRLQNSQRNRILDEVIQICKEHLEDIKVSHESGVFDSTSAQAASQENKLIIDAVEKLKVCQ